LKRPDKQKDRSDGSLLSRITTVVEPESSD
jgi:hypothetical protein